MSRRYVDKKFGKRIQKQDQGEHFSVRFLVWHWCRPAASRLKASMRWSADICSVTWSLQSCDLQVAVTGHIPPMYHCAVDASNLNPSDARHPNVHTGRAVCRAHSACTSPSVAQYTRHTIGLVDTRESSTTDVNFAHQAPLSRLVKATYLHIQPDTTARLTKSRW